MNIDIIIVLLLLVIVTAQLLLLYRSSSAERREQALAEQMQKAMQQEVHGLFNQFESYNYLRDRLNLRQGLPYTTDWSAAPDFLKLIVEHALQHKPKTIVECSSGLTTVMLARCCQLNENGEVFSLENGADYAEKTRGHLARYALTQASVIHAPLQKHPLNGSEYDWYGITKLPAKSIDMLVIDGPPGFIQKHSRYPALPLLFDKLADGCVIFMDDAARPDEKEIVKMWIEAYPELEERYVSTERGCSVLVVGG